MRSGERAAHGRSRRRRARGFTYIGVLLAVALLGATLAATGEIWHTAQMREKEKELLFVGQQYRRAIQLYYENSPGPIKRYPREMSDLIKDPRHQTIRRYLRKLYRDPVTGKSEWGTVAAPDGGIAGVYSLSTDPPFKTANFSTADAAFEGKVRYSDWKFVFLPSQARPAPAEPPKPKP